MVRLDARFSPIDTRFSSSDGERCDVLLLDAETRQALTTMRSLGSRGVRVAALANKNVSCVPGFASRWCQKGLVGPASATSEEYAEYLEQVVQMVRPHILMASTHGTIALLWQYHARLEAHTHVVLPKEPALGIVLNKGRLMEIARGLGLEVPKGVHIREASEVGEALRFVGLPAVVRPVDVQGLQPGITLDPVLVTTSEEAKSSVEASLRLGREVLFQQYFLGPRESLSFIRAQGEIVAQFAQRTKRASSSVGGLDILRSSIASPADSSSQAVYLLEKIDLEGYCRVDFRRDYSGKPYLIDIDPYPAAGTELAIQAGIDFPSLLYQWSRGERIEKVQEYRVGISRRDLAEDFVAMMTIVRQHGKPGSVPARRALRDFCLSFLTLVHYDYLDWQDIRPAWTAARAYFGETWARMMKK